MPQSCTAADLPLSWLQHDVPPPQSLGAGHDSQSFASFNTRLGNLLITDIKYKNAEFNAILQETKNKPNYT